MKAAGLLLCLLPLLLAQDREMVDLASRLKESIAKSGRKTVAVVNFSNSQGYGSAFGDYLADQLGVLLVRGGSGFEVVTRSRLSDVMKENNFKYSDLFDKKTFQRLGQFSGADALVTGSFRVGDNTVTLTVQVLDTTKGTIVGGDFATLQRTRDTETLLGPIGGTGSGGGPDPGPPPGDAIQQVEKNGILFRLNQCVVSPTAATCKFTITSPKRDRGIGIIGDYQYKHCSMFDQNGSEYRVTRSSIANNSRGDNSNGFLVRDIPVPAEVTFGLNADVILIPLMNIYIGDREGGDFTVEFRNIKPIKENPALAAPASKRPAPAPAPVRKK